MRCIDKVSTDFQSFEIWQGGRTTEFRVEGAVHAWHHRDRYLTGLAWDLIAAGALLGRQPPRSILMLGLAGGTAFRILRHLLPECQLTAVDIDPQIVGLAREHMNLDALEAEVIMGDAYEWLKQSGRRFDVVIDDVYLAGREDVYRPCEWNDGLVKLLAQAVLPGGVLAANLVTGAGHRTFQSSTRRALRHAFPVLRSIQSPGALNEVLVAGRQVAAGQRIQAYRDRFADSGDRAYWRQIFQRKL